MILLNFNKARLELLEEQCFQVDRLKIMPSAFYREFDQQDLSAFCVKHGLYSLPTTELIDALNGLIMEASPTRNAIEIGAGNGAIGRALGIPSTDSYLQTDPSIRAYYDAIRQPVTTYGSDVLRLDANTAVRQLRPDVVIGAWVTHMYRPEQHELGGNALGIDEDQIVDSVNRYIVVGNHSVHSKKTIMTRLKRVIETDFLYSRSLKHSSENAIFIFE